MLHFKIISTPVFTVHKEKKKPTTLFLLIIALANGYIFYEKT